MHYFFILLLKHNIYKSVIYYLFSLTTYANFFQTLSFHNTFFFSLSTS